MKDLFTHPQETWSAARCRKEARRVNRDGLGTVGGPKGLIAPSGSGYLQYGETKRYNGGTIIGGELYQSEHLPLPSIPDGFRFEHVTSWGVRIVATN